LLLVLVLLTVGGAMKICPQVTSEEKIVRQTVDSYLQGLKFNDVESFKRASLEAYEDSRYTDYISLLKLADGWKIVNKVFVVERRAA
jgi:hypothetical protein